MFQTADVLMSLVHDTNLAMKIDSSSKNQSAFPNTTHLIDPLRKNEPGPTGSPNNLSSTSLIALSLAYTIIFLFSYTSYPDLRIWPTMLFATTACIAGVVTHNALFVRGEWHLKAPLLLKIYLLSFILSLMFQINSHPTFAGGLTATLLVTISYVFTLLCSMTLYRVLFHRLRSFPGPPLARVTKFWHSAKCYDSQNHFLLDDLRKTYGNFVRTGPNEITIFEPEIFAAYDGYDNRCTKSAWYDFLQPAIGLNTTREKKVHDERRRIWDHAFSARGTAPQPILSRLGTKRRFSSSRLWRSCEKSRSAAWEMYRSSWWQADKRDQLVLLVYFWHHGRLCVCKIPQHVVE